MTRKVLLGTVALAVLAVLGGAGAYAYFFSGLRTSPPQLALSSPSASPTVSASEPMSTAGSASWQITTGSLVGYRVKEQFVGQTSTHEAVARTSDVTGQVTITQSDGAYQLSTATMTVQLSSLASVDSVAGYNVTNRDRFVAQSLDVNSYPTATFTAQSVTLPAAVESGQTVNLSVPGQLTIHGVTKTVTAAVQLRVTGNTAQIAGSITIDMTDYGVTAPQVPFTTAESGVTIEFQLNLTRSG